MFTVWVPFVGSAQELHQELQETVRAEVIEIIDEHDEEIIGTDTTRLIQTVRIRVKSGVREGDSAIFINDLMELKNGDSIYVNRLIAIDGTEYYQFKDVDRRWSLLSLIAVFTATLLFFFWETRGARTHWAHAQCRAPLWGARSTIASRV